MSIIHGLLFLMQDLGIETQSHLNLKPVPNELLPALEEHLKDMEKKGFSASSSTEAAASIKCVCVCAYVCVRMCVRVRVVCVCM